MVDEADLDDVDVAFESVSGARFAFGLDAVEHGGGLMTWHEHAADALQDERSEIGTPAGGNATAAELGHPMFGLARGGAAESSLGPFVGVLLHACFGFSAAIT